MPVDGGQAVTYPEPTVRGFSPRASEKAERPRPARSEGTTIGRGREVHAWQIAPEAVARRRSTRKNKKGRLMPALFVL